MATTRLMTADELLELTGPERYELLRGELLEMSPTGWEHTNIGYRIGRIVGNFVYDHNLGDLATADGGFRLESDPDTVFSPDFAFVRADRLPPPSERIGFLSLAPDLVVEVLSPSDRPGQVATKISTYQVFGVQTIWLVDPREQSVTVYALGQVPYRVAADETLDGGDVLPGFAVQVGEFFSR